MKDFDFDIAIARFIFPQFRAARCETTSRAIRQDQGLQQSCRDCRSGVDALVEKAVAAQTQRHSTTPAARSTACCAPAATGFRTGARRRFWIAYWDQFGFPATKPRYARRRAGDLVVRPGQGRQTRSGEIAMSAYIARRMLLMIPTLLGILFVSFVVVQFAPGGPVERVIAQLSRRRYRLRPRACRAPPAAISAHGPRPAPPPMRSIRNTAARRGSIRSSSRSSRSSSASTGRRRSVSR